MRVKKLFTLLPLLIILFIVGCDENNNSTSAEDPGAMESGCPCFNLDGLDMLGDNSTDIQCSIEPFSILLMFNSQGMPELSVGCLADGTGCTCIAPIIGVTDLNSEQASVCFETILNAMIMFNNDEVKLDICMLSGN
ncbi:MAG: hypothetical protein DHS20C13_04470 [Thermodesulfobacteriota bacterium]|nr:MAG: hypothetical protein DHS20C13_04470 [Thermodesulfobacteriota bacterium]